VFLLTAPPATDSHIGNADTGGADELL
jgi:hypothetical protein